VTIFHGRQKERLGLRSWSRARWLVVTMLLVAAAAAVVLIVMYAGGSSGSGVY